MKSKKSGIVREAKVVITYSFADPLLDPAAILIFPLLHLNTSARAKDIPCRVADGVGVCVGIDCETSSREVRSSIRVG